MLTIASVASSAAFTLGTPEHALAQWIKKEGGFVSGDLACEVRGGRRGLFVTADVAAGDVLAAIPQQCCISAQYDPQFGLSLHELTTSRLLGAVARGEHAEYCETLPADEKLLSEWSVEELAMLQSPALEYEVLAQRERVDASVERLAPWVADDLSAEKIAWAERMVRSRALRFEPGWDGGDESSLCMVPLIDLANHATPGMDDEAAAGYVDPVCLVGSVSGKSGTAILRASRDMPAGAEATFPYRREGNGALLLDYGFAELPDMHRLDDERVWLDFEDRFNEKIYSDEYLASIPPPDDPPPKDGEEEGEEEDAAAEAEAEEEAIVTTPPPPITIGCSDELDAAAVAALNLQLCQFEQSHGADLPTSEVLVAYARGTIRGACSVALAKMVTSVDEDRAELLKVEDGSREAAAICFRIGQKAKVKRLVEELDALPNSLSSGANDSPTEAQLLEALKRARSEAVEEAEAEAEAVAPEAEANEAGVEMQSADVKGNVLPMGSALKKKKGQVV